MSSRDDKMKYRFYEPKAATQMLQQMIHQRYNFIRASSSAFGSGYYTKMGFMHKKIRVSDHPALSRNDDVIHEIVVKQPMLFSDIEWHAKHANDVFVHATGKRVSR